MTPELRAIRDRFFTDIDRVIAALDDVDPADAAWSPVRDGASLLVLARHVLGGAEQIPAELARVAYTRDRDREFLDPGTPEEVRAAAAAAKERIDAAFEVIDPAVLEREAPTPAAPSAPPKVPSVWSGRSRRRTGRDVLLERIAHIAEHAGHAELTRDLIRERRRA